MSDLTKKSGIVYLSVFLLLICAAATAVMAIASQMTKKPIAERQKKRIEQTLVQVLPEFDSMEQKDVKSPDGTDAVFYTVKKNGVPAGYAVQTSTARGYGGSITALVGFTPEKTIYRVVVISQNETPGIGTKVVSRQEVRKVSSLFRKKEPVSPSAVPANEALDSYQGKEAFRFVSGGTDIVTGATVKSRKSGNGVGVKEEIHFITGATVSSNAMFDLVSRACAVVQDQTKKGK